MALRITLLTAAGAAVLAWFYMFDPATADAFLPCPFRAATGWSCPGCGTQRALHLLLHGQAAAALRSNPLALLLLPVTAYVFVQYGLGAKARRALPDIPLRGAAAWVVGLAVVAYWVLRNIIGW